MVECLGVKDTVIGQNLVVNLDAIFVSVNGLQLVFAELIQQKGKETNEIEKNIQEDQRVANDENEEPSVRERAREKITENTEKKIPT